MVKGGRLGKRFTGQQGAQKLPQPAKQSGEVVADGGQHGVCCIAMAADQIVAVHAVVAFQVADDGLYSRTSLEFALNGSGHAALLL